MNRAQIKLLLEKIVSEVIAEGKVQDLQKQYPHVADYIEQAQTKMKLKYLTWFSKTISKEKEFDFEEVINTINYFDSLSSRGILKGPETDINQYDLNSLSRIVKEKENETSKTEKKKLEKENSKLIYRDERFVIVQPLDMEASCHYGSETRWCISATKSDNLWDSYQHDDFIFIIDRQAKNPYYKKVAVRFNDKSSFSPYDVNDNIISNSKFFELYPPFVYDLLRKESGMIIPDSEMVEKLTQDTLSQVLKSPDDYNELIQEIDENHNKAVRVVKNLIELLPFELLYLTTLTNGTRPISLKDQLVNRLERENRTIDELLKLIGDAVTYYDFYFSYVEFPLEEIVKLKMDTEEDLKKIHNWVHPVKKINTYSTLVMRYLSDMIATAIDVNKHVLYSYVTDQIFKKNIDILSNPNSNSELIGQAWSYFEGNFNSIYITDFIKKLPEVLEGLDVIYSVTATS